MTTHFHPFQATAAPPSQFNDPFDYEPHPLCAMAARQVSIYINKVEAWQADLTAGKMLGVLVCRRADGQLGFLAAYSGLLAGRNDWDYFVPPVFDAQQPDGHFKTTERAISAINAEVRVLTEQAATLQPEEKERLLALKRQRKLMSEELQLWLFRQYRVLKTSGATSTRPRSSGRSFPCRQAAPATAAPRSSCNMLTSSACAPSASPSSGRGHRPRARFATTASSILLAGASASLC